MKRITLWPPFVCDECHVAQPESTSAQPHYWKDMELCRACAERAYGHPMCVRDESTGLHVGEIAPRCIGCNRTETELEAADMPLFYSQSFGGPSLFPCRCSPCVEAECTTCYNARQPGAEWCWMCKAAHPNPCRDDYEDDRA